MDETPPVRVVIADTHRGMLMTARALLEAEGIEVLASAGELDRAVRLAAAPEVDVLVVDLHMLGAPSRARVAELCGRLPHAAVVILTMEASPALVPAVIDAGACGYVLKEFAESDLAHAVRQAVVGERFISARVSA